MVIAKEIPDYEKRLSLGFNKGGATWWLGGAVAPAKKKNFPLDYEEKIIRPPQP